MPDDAVIIIPARLSSSRLKEKPLIKLKGKTVIRRVWENALRAERAATVVVAADSEKIKHEVESAGGKCILTPDNLNSGSDRVYYTADKYFPQAKVIVNLQGDEPFIDSELVDRLIDLALSEKYVLYSAYFPVCREEAKDSSTVKVVVNKNNEALYFSRNPVPAGGDIYKKHIGIYVWQKEALREFYHTPPSELEKTEKLEQLRVLESGNSIRMMESPKDSIGIDTEQDLIEAERYLNEEY